MSDQNAKPFHQLPSNKFIWVTECGSVLDSREKVVRKAAIGNWGYRSIDIAGERYHIHTMMCEIFHGPMSQEGMVANHKDGDKSNNSKDNLEWVTRSENIIHAYKTGLRSDNRIVHIRDVTTGKETSFYSMQEAARFFKCNAEKLFRWIKGRTRRPFDGKYDIRYDDTNFKGLLSSDVDNRVNGLPREVLLVASNGDMSIYGTLGLAAPVAGVNREKLARHVRGTSKRKPLGKEGYMAFYLDEYEGTVPDDTPNIPYVEPRKIVPVRKPTPIEVTIVSTGAKQTYASTEEFANKLGCEKSTVQKATRLKEWRGLQIRYIRDEEVIPV